jgi:hypothetical protein
VDATGESKLLDATVLGAAGLAFCYVASAPILLLHATRAQRGKANRPRTQVGWLSILRTPTAAIVEFCRRLAEERAYDPKEALGRKRKEYIQPYRDMREHGNALLILVKEAVLTTVLLQATNLGILLEQLA